MKRFIAVAAALLVAFTPIASPGGVCGVRVAQKQVIATQVVKIPTNYAVALGVPVGQYTGTSYDFRAGQQAIDQNEIAAVRSELQQIRTLLQQLTGITGQAEVEPAAPTLLQTNCAKCHSGEMAKGGFRLDLGPLSPDDVVRASRAVVSGSMPKDPPPSFDDQARGNLLGELLGVQ